LYTLTCHHMTLAIDLQGAHIASLTVNGTERIVQNTPLFRIRLRDIYGEPVTINAWDAISCTETADGAIYTDFQDRPGMEVQVYITEKKGDAAWRIRVTPPKDTFAEWVDFPLVTLPALADNNKIGNGGSVLLPYNEGALISDELLRRQTDFRHFDYVYPSLGCYSLFPNMISAQMMAYLWDDAGLYLGAHDPRRAVKGIDFYGDENGITMLMRLFCGTDFGESFSMDYDILWSVTDNRWESAAEIYRAWFASSLPPKVTKIKDNPALPDWYEDSPLVVSYPVRGVHDMDEMSPNALFPYTNALPLLDELRAVTESRLMVLLMHWEGTAPWAPPYVWPPFGGTENFNAFKEALHEKRDLLGVYCSGFGYTIQSNLIADYNCQAEYDARRLEAGMCAGPDGKVAISKICTGQRKGYDICPASPVGHDLLAEAYAPLFESGLDYVQILDQNHGGGQYFCYSRDHGHPPAPGAWMTEHMQTMLSEWNDQAPNILFGCESAAAEPFIGNLLFSDNRFELNYMTGRPVPLYAYLYHEYVRNFMGNQVSCHLMAEKDTLPYRIAYAFAAGDCMTVVLTPEGKLLPYWGARDFSKLPDKDVVLTLIANLTRFYREKAKPFLHAGRMIPALPVECEAHPFFCNYVDHRFTMPAVHTSAWETEDGRRAQILVNPQTKDIACTVDGASVTVPALDALLIEGPL